MDASLLVLAAGMGSRYGGLKQMDDFGPNGETIIDYSIYDAINAGFNKIVFVIRSSFRNDFERFFRERLGDRIKLEFVEQELTKIPDGFQLNPEREKPWGTAHAVMMGSEVINEDFAVINADDYYGQESYGSLINYFKNRQRDDEFAVVSYLLMNTLSDHGTVNRGICQKDNNDFLTDIVETLQISRNTNGIITYPSEGGPKVLEEDTLVSMNMFGFNPKYFELADQHFRHFLEHSGNELKSEYFIPYSLDQMINAHEAKVKVITSPASWFGVTYKEDKPIVVDKIKALINRGVYPENLWA